MAGDKTYITDSQGKLHRATRVHAVTPTDIVWSSNPNDYTVQVKIDGKWHRAVLTMDAGSSTFFDNINIDKALVTGADGKQHTALIVKPESTVTLSDIKTDTHGTIAGTTTGETAVSTYSENWSNVKWQDNVNVYKVLVTGSDGKVHTALLTTSAGGDVQVIVLGPSPLLLPDAIANSLSYVKAFGGTEQRNVPQNYIEREYVYMLPNSCALTNIVPTYNGHYELDFQTTTIGGTAYSILGGRTSGAPAGLQFARISSGWVVDGFGQRYESSIAPIAETHYKFTFDNQVAKLESEGSTVFNTTFTTSDATGAALCINGMNTNGTVSVSPAGIYVYSFKAWDNAGNLVANYIPVVQRYPTAAGFYDTVSGNFIGATEGTITGGPEAVPTPDAPMDIVSNNGVVKVNNNLGAVYADGTVETIEDTIGNTATTETLLKVGDYQDVQSILDGVVTRNVGVKVLDGSENFETATATNCYSLTNTLGTGNFADRTIVCSHFASTPTLPGTGDRQGLAFIVNKGAEYTIAFGATTQFSTQALWQQFLANQYAAGTPVIIVYPLATPTTETVAGQTLQVTGGDNVLEITQASLDGLELEAEYQKVV